jgi:hypothetical protein
MPKLAPFPNSLDKPSPPQPTGVPPENADLLEMAYSLICWLCGEVERLRVEKVYLQREVATLHWALVWSVSEPENGSRTWWQ